ncbi:MAG: hypothetical protein B0A82_21555 [Alkalinema sp. CACIAM 70d]|nr:MAG: hypothetical protein B0A82_21555 [Alkalinema sp. CACIAM 70d]
MLQNGLTVETYAWRSGMAGWQRAQDIPELAAILNSAPPPPLPCNSGSVSLALSLCLDCTPNFLS